MYRPNTYRGVTLVELLIVIAIIGMLIQLTLPAIQSSREAARRTACQNNLRQIMIAVRAHESAHNYLPTAGWGWAWIGDADRGPGKTQPGSWAFQLLPYLDYRDVHEIGRGAKGDEKIAALTRLAATPVPLFYCPTRRSDVATPNAGPAVSDHVKEFDAGDLFWYNAKKADRLARTDYAASAGDRFVYWNAGPTPEQAEKGEGFFKFRDLDGKETTLEEITGVVVQRQPITLAQVIDGTSNTYLIGEKNIPIEAYDAGWNANDDQSAWNGDDLDTVATAQFRPRRDFSVSAKQEGRVGVPFGSAHADGFNMVMCDGSIRYIGYDIDPEIHRALGNRRDSRVLLEKDEDEKEK